MSHELESLIKRQKMAKLRPVTRLPGLLDKLFIR